MGGRIDDDNAQCCGNCLSFNGEMRDGTQFCDTLEMYVRDNSPCCPFFERKPWINNGSEWEK
jgi:hypothetical protein